MTPIMVGEIRNFNAKYRVDNTAPEVFKEGLPSIMWNGAQESITKYRTSMVLMFGSALEVVLNLMTPRTLALSL